MVVPEVPQEGAMIARFLGKDTRRSSLIDSATKKMEEMLLNGDNQSRSKLLELGRQFRYSAMI